MVKCIPGVLWERIIELIGHEFVDKSSQKISMLSSSGDIQYSGVELYNGSNRC